MQRTIQNPHWINNARTMLSAEFHYEDGRVVTAVISDTDKGNPDLQEILRTFTGDELEANTRAKIKKVNQENEIRRQKDESKVERQKQEELFAMKLKAFEIDIIRTSQNRSLKSKIRRAKNDFEVMAYTAALILDIENNSQTTET